MEDAQIYGIVVIIVGLALFMLYLVLVKKKEPKEALEEVIDYAIEHREELLSLTEKDLLKMDSEELVSLCEKLGLPAVGSNVELASQIFDHINTELNPLPPPPDDT